MSAALFDPHEWLALAALLVALFGAFAAIMARSLMAQALLLAVFAGALAAAFAALGALDLGLLEAALGIGIAPLCWIGAMTLTAPSARRGAMRVRLAALAGAGAAGAAMGWAALDLPARTAADEGRVYVGRAWAETGVRNAVAAVAGNYHAIDTLAQIGALTAAALGVYAVLGFGERARGARAREERDRT